LRIGGYRQGDIRPTPISIQKVISTQQCDAQPIAWLRSVALFEFLATPAWARVVAADIFQRITHRLLVPMVAVRAVHVAVVLVVVVIMVVVAVRTMNVGFVAHQRVTPE
jgi:hypothetical protein